jgi:hypothetical protein
MGKGRPEDIGCRSSASHLPLVIGLAMVIFAEKVTSTCLLPQPFPTCLMLRQPLTLAAGLLLATPFAHARVRLPALVGSHMVLQRGRPVPVWG